MSFRTRKKSRKGNGPRRRLESDRTFEARQRAFQAISLMRREGVSLWDAARDEGTTASTIRKYLPAALRKTRTGALDGHQV